MKGYDEPEILPSSTHPICLMSADGGQYRFAASQRFALAQYDLGFMYHKGRGVPQNYAEAMKWFASPQTKASPALRTFSGSCTRTARACRRTMPRRRSGIASLRTKGRQRPDQSRAHVREGAGGHAELCRSDEMVSPRRRPRRRHAQNNLGLMYENGQGVPKNYAEARSGIASLRTKASPALRISRAHVREGAGGHAEYAEAVKWFRFAADQGDASAQYALGLMYGKGQGVTQNYAEAVKWFASLRTKATPALSMLSGSCTGTAAACRTTMSAHTCGSTCRRLAVTPKMR